MAQAARRKGFDLGDVLLRVAFGVGLVLATFNPTGVSFVHWAFGAERAQLSVVALAGVTLLILWAIYLRATFRALGPFGLALAGGFVAALLWVLTDWGLLSLSGGTALQWAALAGLGVVLGIGLSWSHVRRALSGQADVDDVGD